MFYLTSYSPVVSERLHMLVIPASAYLMLRFPAFERGGELLGLPDRHCALAENENPVGHVYRALDRQNRQTPIQITIIEQTLSVFLLHLQAALPQAQFEVASGILVPLCQAKDQIELEVLREVLARAVNPEVLALVWIFQSFEKLPDRVAAEA